MSAIDTTYLTPEGATIPVRVFQPATANAKGGGIVVAYGSEGLNAPFDRLIDDHFCQVIAGSGYVVARPDYFRATGTAHGTLAAVAALFSGASTAWVSALAAAVSWLPTQGFGVQTGRMGIAGFSLGGNLALQAAGRAAVKGVIDFFGPIDLLPGAQIAAALLIALPPIQIHHGTEDALPKGVPYSQSQALHQLLTSNHREVEFHSYPGQGHPAQFAGSWTLHTQQQAVARTLQFLDDRL